MRRSLPRLTAPARPLPTMSAGGPERRSGGSCPRAGSLPGGPHALLIHVPGPSTPRPRPLPSPFA
eukprot:6910223-Alexandrium_andersonii.AAC.1